MKKIGLIIIGAIFIIGLIFYALSIRYYPIEEGMVLRSYRLTGKVERFIEGKWESLQEYKQK